MDTIGRRTIHRGRKFDFEQVTLAGRSGERLEREVVRHPGAVVILPILERVGRRHIVMIRSHRFSIGRELLELPAGTLDRANGGVEEPLAAAGRELEEETGYSAATVRPLTRFYTTPGMTDELMWAFVASGLREVGQRLEADEDLVPEVVEAGRALSMALSGELLDGKTILTLLFASAKGLLA